MKKIIATALLLAAGHSSLAQKDHRIELEPAIEQVTVYLNGGEVRCGHAADVVSGRNVMMLKGLSPHVFPQSVQVTVKGDAAEGPEILSVSTASNFLVPGKLEPRIDHLKDSVDMLQERITELDDRMGARNAEKEMLARNYGVGGQQAVTAEALAKAADFFRDRTLVVNEAISKLMKEQVQVKEQLARTQQQLNELNYRHDPERKEVTIMLLAARAEHVRVDLRYLVANTGWSPTYDLVAKDITHPVTLRYKAQVYNNTGIDWSNVKLTLSTADPSLGASKPELTRWALGLRSAPMISNAEERFQGMKGMDLNQSQAYSNQQLILADNNQTYAAITVAEVSAEFPITRPYDIPSDAKPYLVDIAEHTVDASYSYLAIPKLDKDAFLLARITGWEKLNLVDGKANVYYGDSYVGESRINTQSTEDTLDLSLGRDNNVQITRVQKEDITSHAFIGSDRKESMTFEITVKNNGSAPLTIDVKDQVPVSEDSDIKVDVQESSGATPNETSGEVKWTTSLQPGASKVYKLSFSIRYPKTKTVQYRRLRTVAAPSW